MLTLLYLTMTRYFMPQRFMIYLILDGFGLIFLYSVFKVLFTL